jgi:hypothetical protein
MKKIGFVIGRLFILCWPLIILFVFWCSVHRISKWWVVIAVIAELMVISRIFRRGVEIIGKNDPYHVFEENDEC